MPANAAGAKPALDFIEGKSLDKSITSAITLAKREGVAVRILRRYTSKAGEARTKVIFWVSPQGDVSEPQAPTLRVRVAEWVFEQAMVEIEAAGGYARASGPAGRLMEVWNSKQGRKVA